MELGFLHDYFLCSIESQTDVNKLSRWVRYGGHRREWRKLTALNTHKTPRRNTDSVTIKNTADSGLAKGENCNLIKVYKFGAKTMSMRLAPKSSTGFHWKTNLEESLAIVAVKSLPDFE